MSQQTLRNVPPIVFVQDKEAAALAEVRPLGNDNVNFYMSKISKKIMCTVLKSYTLKGTNGKQGSRARSQPSLPKAGLLSTFNLL